jgi:hypothetical protein
MPHTRKPAGSARALRRPAAPRAPAGAGLSQAPPARRARVDNGTTKAGRPPARARRSQRWPAPVPVPASVRTGVDARGAVPGAPCPSSNRYSTERSDRAARVARASPVARSTAESVSAGGEPARQFAQRAQAAFADDAGGVFADRAEQAFDLAVCRRSAGCTRRCGTSPRGSRSAPAQQQGLVPGRFAALVDGGDAALDVVPDLRPQRRVGIASDRGCFRPSVGR